MGRPRNGRRLRKSHPVGRGRRWSGEGRKAQKIYVVGARSGGGDGDRSICGMRDFGHKPVSYPSFGPSESGSRSALWKVPRAARQFAWPLWTGMVTSGFGIRRGVMHKGVDIAAPEGTPVHAADAGVVIFVGRLPGYGNTVIIQHSGNYVTIYAHDRENVVRAGQSVSCGEVIGAIGTSGRATGPPSSL